MLVNRKVLIDHLQHLHCAGQMQDAVLTPRLGCQGLSLHQDLLIIAEAPKWDLLLPREVGVVNLELMVKMLEVGAEEQVALDLDGSYLVLETPDQRTRLVTASPNVISSRAPEHVVEQIVAHVNQHAMAPCHLPARLVQSILTAVGRLGAESVTISTGPEGSQVLIGESAANSTSLQWKELRSPVAYEVVFLSPLLTAVLRQVSDFTQATLALTGPKSVVVVQEGYYRYILSPAAAADAVRG